MSSEDTNESELKRKKTKKEGIGVFRCEHNKPFRWFRALSLNPVFKILQKLERMVSCLRQIRPRRTISKI